jgi:hypothetical protein
MAEKCTHFEKSIASYPTAERTGMALVKRLFTISSAKEWYMHWEKGCLSKIQSQHNYKLLKVGPTGLGKKTHARHSTAAIAATRA